GVSHPNGDTTNTPTLVIGDDCVNQEDYSCCLNGKVKGFGSLSNLKVVLGNEGFNEIGIRYLGGLWVMLVFRSVDGKEKFKVNVGTNSWFSQLIETSSDFVVDGRVAWVEVEGILLKDSNCSESLKFPPGFTPSVKKEVGCNMDKRELNCDNLNKGASNQGDHVNVGIDNSYSKREGTESVGSGCFKKGDALRTGRSILTVMDELIKVGQTMGFKMDGCMKNIKEIIESQGVNEEIPLGGCSFTWCHKSGSKMSKLDRFIVSESLLSVCPTLSSITLDRFFSDHRPILLRESTYDYGPSPFRFFKYWAEVDGFEKLIVETWSDTAAYGSNDMLNLMYKLKNLKKKIRDENSNNYHGILNIKRNNLAIRDVLEAGKWIENPDLVKKEFLNHFKNRFGRPKKTRHVLITEFPRQLNSMQRMDMEADVTIEESKMWRFWSVIQKDVVAAVKCFFHYGSIPKGCNSSFIAFIPKILDAKMVKDFRPISLLGTLYKIIAKILANRLVTVLGDVINEIHSAFMADRQILDSPFILNEVLQWCKLKKKQSFIFKIDFEKAYDSVRLLWLGLLGGSPEVVSRLFSLRSWKTSWRMFFSLIRGIGGLGR
nr:RNA-directed DNA polymerase, eukaryota, reverse transcriptase zinc-binding domain protein [Tanacetum cinerariifolium]